MATYALAPYLVAVVALSVIYAWIHGNTRGSPLIVTLWHAASNTVGPFVGLEQTAVVSLAALAIVIVYGPTSFVRREEGVRKGEVPRPATRALSVWRECSESDRRNSDRRTSSL